MSVYMNKKFNGKQENKTTSWRDIDDIQKWFASRDGGVAFCSILYFPISKNECTVVLQNYKQLTTCYYEERR